MFLFQNVQSEVHQKTLECLPATYFEMKVFDTKQIETWGLTTKPFKARGVRKLKAWAVSNIFTFTTNGEYK